MLQYPAKAKKEAVALYESGLSCRAVAEWMTVNRPPAPHYVTVLRWVKEAGKGRKQRGHRFPLSGESVRALYDCGVRADEIGRQFHVGTTTIYKRLHEADAKMRPSRIKYGHLLTARRLRALYTEKNSPARDIAMKFGCSVGTVYNWLRRNDIPPKRHRRTP